MLKIDRSEVDKAIENLEMFTDTEKVLDDYETEKKVLIKREEDLNKRVVELQEEHTQLLLDREIVKDSTSDYIYLSKQLSVANDEMQIIVSLQEQLKDDFRALKQKYIPIIRGTYSKDLQGKNEFPVNFTVESVRYELIKAIADYANEIREQQQPLIPLIGEFLDDEELMEENRGFRRLFEFDSTNLSYTGELSKSFIHRNHIFYACGGNVHPEIRKPQKDVE